MHEDVHSKREWAQLIREGKAVFEQLNRSTWELADLMLRVAPVGAPAAGDLIARFAVATDYDGTITHLMHLRQAAAAWPAEYRRSRINTFSVHRSLQAHPDRFELIKEKMTKIEAEELKHQTAPQIKPKSSNRLEIMDALSRITSAASWVRSAGKVLAQTKSMTPRYERALETRLLVLEDEIATIRQFIEDSDEDFVAA